MICLNIAALPPAKLRLFLPPDKASIPTIVKIGWKAVRAFIAFPKNGEAYQNV